MVVCAADPANGKNVVRFGIVSRKKLVAPHVEGGWDEVNVGVIAFCPIVEVMTTDDDFVTKLGEETEFVRHVYEHRIVHVKIHRPAREPFVEHEHHDEIFVSQRTLQVHDVAFFDLSECLEVLPDERAFGWPGGLRDGAGGGGVDVGRHSFLVEPIHDQKRALA